MHTNRGYLELPTTFAEEVSSSSSKMTSTLTMQEQEDEDDVTQATTEASDELQQNETQDDPEDLHYDQEGKPIVNLADVNQGVKDNADFIDSFWILLKNTLKELDTTKPYAKLKLWFSSYC